MKNILKFIGATAVISLCLLLCQTPQRATGQSANGGSVVGVNTRFGSFSNNALLGTNGPVILTSGASTNLWTNGAFEVPLDAGRGLGLFCLLSTTNNSNATNTATVTLYFDVSPFGTTNKQAAFAGFNTNYLNFGASSNYTLTNFWSWSITQTYSNNVLWATNIPASLLDNFRYLRLSQIAVTTGGGIADGVTISNVVWSKFP